MPKMLKSVWLLCVLVMSGCASGPALQPVRYLEAPPKRLPPIPADLQIPKTPKSCRKLLQNLSASQETLRKTCETITPSSTTP